MDCPACGAPTLAFPVPADRRAYLPGDEPGAAICTRCLTLHPVADPPASVPDLQEVSAAFPADDAAALPFALMLGLLENLALYREEIGELLATVEAAGTDPLLALDRLAHDEAIDAAVDLQGRRRQLEQLL